MKESESFLVWLALLILIISIKSLQKIKCQNATSSPIHKTARQNSPTVWQSQKVEKASACECWRMCEATKSPWQLRPATALTWSAAPLCAKQTEQRGMKWDWLTGCWSLHVAVFKTQLIGKAKKHSRELSANFCLHVLKLFWKKWSGNMKKTNKQIEIKCSKANQRN